MYFLNFIVYAFSFLIPRKKNRWLFGCGFGYCDNPKYLYLDVANNNPEIDSWWVTKDKSETKRLNEKGVRVVYYRSFRGLYLALTAKVYVYSHHTVDINFFTSGNSFKVNLFHGIALKVVEWGINKESANYVWFDGTLKSRFHYPANYEKHDLLLVPGELCLNHYIQMI